MSAQSDLAQTRLAQILLTGGLLVAGMLLGLAAQALIAYYFGASARSDALFLARESAELLAKLALPAQAAGVLIPMFMVLARQHDESQAWQAIAAVMTSMLALAVPLAAAASLAAPWLVDFVAPGFDASTADLAVVLLRILGPTVASAAVGAVAVGLLQARERFGRAMSTYVVGGLVTVVALIVLVDASGVRGAAVAILIGSFSQAIMAWVLLVQEGMPVLAAPWRSRGEVGEFARRLTPFLAYAGAVLVSGVVLRISASTLAAGLFAVLVLAQRLYRAVVSLVMTPVQMVLLPVLSRHEAGNSPDAATVELFATIRYLLTIIVPVAVSLIILRTETVSLAFERGEFSQADADATAVALGFFALALIPVGLYTMLEQAGFARRRTQLVIGVNLALEGIQAALYYPLTVALGVRGIPLAIAIATSVATVLYLRQLHRGQWREVLLAEAFGLRLLGATAALALATLGAAAALQALADPAPGLANAIVLGPAALVGTAAFIAAARVIRFKEPERLGRLLSARFRAR